jgi:hypothetical protein
MQEEFDASDPQQLQAVRSCCCRAVLRASWMRIGHKQRISGAYSPGSLSYTAEYHGKRQSERKQQKTREEASERKNDLAASGRSRYICGSQSRRHSRVQQESTTGISRKRQSESTKREEERNTTHGSYSPFPKREEVRGRTYNDSTDTSNTRPCSPQIRT